MVMYYSGRSKRGEYFPREDIGREDSTSEVTIERTGGVPFADEERREFRQLLRDRPELRKLYKDFKSVEGQKLRSRLGQNPFLRRELDILFEIAMASDE